MKCNNIKIGKIHMIEIDNENGLRALFSANGATIYAIYLHGKIMTLSPILMGDLFKKTAYYGKTVGPICGRIKNGLIEIDNESYQLEQNENGNTLHSGETGLSNTIFSARIMNSKSVCSIIYTFKHKPKKGEIPGVVNYYISYAMTTLENKIYVSHRVVPEKEMMLSLTNHSYFCLGEVSIHGLKMKVPASKVVEVNSKDLTPERYIDVPNCLDFRKIAPLTKDINNEYLMNSKTKGIDHFYLLDKKEELIVLESVKYRLEIKSDYEGAQIYSDNYADDIQMISSKIDNYRGVAIEPQDSPLNRRVYSKKNPYNHYIEYTFIEK